MIVGFALIPGGMEGVSETVRAECIVGKIESSAAAQPGALHDPGKLSGAAFVE